MASSCHIHNGRIIGHVSSTDFSTTLRTLCTEQDPSPRDVSSVPAHSTSASPRSPPTWWGILVGRPDRAKSSGSVPQGTHIPKAVERCAARVVHRVGRSSPSVQTAYISEPTDDGWMFRVKLAERADVAASAAGSLTGPSQRTHPVDPARRHGSVGKAQGSGPVSRETEFTHRLLER